MSNLLTVRLPTGELDLRENSVDEFFVTKRLHRLEDLETRDSETSKELVLPRTPHNIRLLGSELPSFRGVFSGTSRPLACEVLMVDVSIISDALLFVLSESISESTITVGIFGGAQKFFNQISTDLISELDFSELDLEWTLANLAALTDTSEGLIYGKCNYNDNESITTYINEKDGINDIDLTALEVGASGIWIFIKTIFLKILANTTGLTYDTTFLDAPFFDDMVLNIPVTQLLDNWTKYVGMNGKVRTETYYEYYFTWGAQKILFDFIYYETPPGLFDLNENEYVITQDAVIDIEFEMRSHYYGQGTEYTREATIYIMQNGVIIHTYKYETGNDLNFFHYKRIQTTANVKVGDTLSVVFIPPTYVLLYDQIQFRGSYFKIHQQGAAAGNYVEISDYLPEITQKDFIKEVFKLGHIIPFEINNHVLFFPWEDIYKQKEFDLTPYLDVSKPIVKTNYIPGYGKNNKFQYVDSDKVARLDTSTELTQDSALLPENVVKIQSKFLPCDVTQLNDTEIVCSPVFGFEYEHVDDNKITIAISSNIFTTTERHGLNPGDFIFVWDDQNLVTMRRKVIVINNDFSGLVDTDWTTGHDEFDWDFIKYRATPINLQIAHARGNEDMTIIDGGEIIETTGKPILFTDSLRWDEIINEFYYNFRATIHKPLFVQAWFNIPLVIFKQMRFGTPAYIGGNDAGLYYINSADQYKFNFEVRLNLIKLESTSVQVIQGSFTVVPEIPVNLGNWKEGDPLPTQIYTITNTGQTILSVGVVLGGTHGMYYEILTGRPIEIPIGENRPCEVRFNGSTDRGANAAMFTFNDNSSVSQVRDITTNVQVYSYTVVPVGTANLGDWNRGDDPISQQYVVTNDGDQPLSVAFNVTGDGYTTPTASPLILLPTETANINVLFTGDTLLAGIKAGVLNLIEGTAGNQIRNLTANVVVFPELTITPLLDVDLGDWGEGDPPLTQAYTWFNSGNVAIDVNASLIQDSILYVITGGSPIFTVFPNTGNVLTVEFNGSIIGGSHDCILSSILSHIPGSVNRNITASVDAIRRFSVVPVEDVDFGDWSEGQALPSQQYLITNLGNIDLTFENDMRGADLEYYNVLPLQITIPRETSAPITASFIGGAAVAGIKQGILNVIESVSRDTESRILTTNIVIPIYSYTVDPIGVVALGDWQESEPPLWQNYTILNTGNQPLSVNIQHSSPAPTEWIVSGGDLPVAIPVGGNAIRTMNFQGSVTLGIRSATLVFIEANAGNQERDINANVVRYPNITLDPPGDVNMGAWTNARLRQNVTLINTGALIGNFRIYVETPPDGESKFLCNKDWRSLPAVQGASPVDFFGSDVGLNSQPVFWEVEGYTPIAQNFSASVAVANPVTIAFEPNEDADLGDWVGADKGKSYNVRNSGTVPTGYFVYCIGDLGFFTSKPTGEITAGGVNAFQIWFDGTSLAPGVYNTLVYAYCPNGNTITFNATCTVP